MVDGKMSGHGHGHDQVYDHDPPRLSRDQEGPNSIDKGEPVGKHPFHMQKLPALPPVIVSLLAGLSANLFVAGQALGAETNVAVLGIEAGEGVPDSVATAVTDALRQRMSLTPGYRLVQGRDLVEVKLVFSCPDEAPPCMAQAAKSMGAGRLLFGTVKKSGADGFALTVKLLDSEKEIVESWTSDQFNRAQASATGLRAPAQKWIATLTGQSVPGTLRIQGGVIGAQVSLDDVGIGVLSATGLGISGVAPGKHELSVSKPGYQTAKKSITLASGDTRDITVDMLPEARTPKPEGATVANEAEAAQQSASDAPIGSSESRMGTKIAAWLTLAGGVAGIVVGIRYSFLVSEANNNLDKFRRFDCKAPVSAPVCDNNNKPAAPITDPGQLAWIDKTKSSANRYQTYQWIGYGVGGALLATSAWLFYRGYIASSSSSDVADARGSSLHLAPMLSPNALGAAAFTTF